MMRIVFMGTGEIGIPSLRFLLDSPEYEVVAVVTQPDKPAGRKHELLASEPKRLALERGIPVLQPIKLRAPESVAEVAAYQPDAIVVMAYGQILPKSVLQMPKLACLNLHASLLPRHRGAAPIQAAIESGDATSGVTVMYMAEGLDTGDILLEKATPILPTDTGGILHDRLGVIAAEALAESLPLLQEGRAPRAPQDESRATYAAKLSRENGEIVWTDAMDKIDRRIRAMNPWPAAYTFLPTAEGERKLKVYACAMHPEDSGAPGQVLWADRRGILVAAGAGAVLLEAVQLEGRKRMSAKDFLSGHPVAAGVVLGQRAGVA